MHKLETIEYRTQKIWICERQCFSMAIYDVTFLGDDEHVQLGDHFGTLLNDLYIYRLKNTYINSDLSTYK